jgi:hypothetical protein
MRKLNAQEPAGRGKKMSLKNAPIPKAIKIRALQYDLTQTDIAHLISKQTGKYLSPKRLNDMIHGQRQGEWMKYHVFVADILGFKPSEIRDVTANAK